MKSYFGDAIIFQQPYDKTQPELVYSSSLSLQNAINAAYRQSTTVEDKTPKMSENEPNDRTKILFRAAQIIKSEIKEVRGIPIQPLRGYTTPKGDNSYKINRTF